MPSTRHGRGAPGAPQAGGPASRGLQGDCRGSGAHLLRRRRGGPAMDAQRGDQALHPPAQVGRPASGPAPLSPSLRCRPAPRCGRARTASQRAAWTCQRRLDVGSIRAFRRGVGPRGRRHDGRAGELVQAARSEAYAPEDGNQRVTSRADRPRKTVTPRPYDRIGPARVLCDSRCCRELRTTVQGGRRHFGAAGYMGARMV